MAISRIATVTGTTTAVAGAVWRPAATAATTAAATATTRGRAASVTQRLSPISTALALKSSHRYHNHVFPSLAGVLMESRRSIATAVSSSTSFPATNTASPSSLTARPKLAATTTATTASVATLSDCAAHLSTESISPNSGINGINNMNNSKGSHGNSNSSNSNSSSSNISSSTDTTKAKRRDGDIVGLMRAMQHILEDTSALALLFSGQPEMYTKPSQLVPHGTVGKHVRHIIEHFELLADAAEALVSHSHRGNDGKLLASDKVILCYNKRNRGSLVESSIPEAVRASDAVQGRLFDLIDNPHITSQLQLLVSDVVDPSAAASASASASASSNQQNGGGGGPGLSPAQPVMVSTFGRELWFCIHHAVHHHATLKVLCMEHDIALSDQFGVAPSTTAHYIEACSSTSSSSTSNQPTTK